MIGQTISHYKILALLGEGGMGVVYKAQDTTLDRFVALKFLPPHLSASEQDKARFLQEARAAATLDHPNICTIYSIEEHDGQMFIVMQFVDGELLRTRMNGLSMKQAIEIGMQVGEGLAAAHEKGIVHRDIKPENIMVRKDGIAQIMDFGLAKLKGVSRLTKEGSTVGTAGYMSPEQVQGQDADHRSDIFSLGVLLYEMFTGRLPFKGVHETAIAYEIVNVDAIPMSVAKPDIDPALDAIVLECLEKDPKERTQSAGQVAVDLKRYRRESSRQRASRITAARPVVSASSPGYSTMPAKEIGREETSEKRTVSWIITAAIAVIMLVIGYGVSSLSSSPANGTPVIRASITMPAGIRYNGLNGGNSSVSPDGSMIVFAGSDSLDRSSLWICQLSSGESRMLSGTERAQYPFWSSDSRSIGFFADGKVKTIDANGGPVLDLADAPFGRGGAWSKSGEIIYAPSVLDPNFYAVQSSGGTSHPITAFDSTTTAAPRFPSFLPDGRHFIFTMLDLSGSATHADIFVGSTDNHEAKKLLNGCSYGMFASGYLFYLRQGMLIAQPFDPGTFALSGTPTSLQGNVNLWAPRAKADFSVTANGVLLYAVSASARTSELFWMNGDGTESPIGQFEFESTVALSPDGTSIAFDRFEPKDGKANVWIYGLINRVKTHLTFDQNGDHPCWSRDGKRIYYNAETGGSKANIFVKQSNGAGEETLLTQNKAAQSVGYYPEEVSPDGRFLLLRVENESRSELATIDVGDPRQSNAVVKLGISGSRGRFSPDGKWIVYQSNESGTLRLYVSSFRGNAGKWQLPSEAGSNPNWGAGRIEYYSAARNRFESCTIAFSSGSPVFGQPQPLFPGGRSQGSSIFGVTKDGKRFLGARPVDSGTGSGLSIVTNWKGLVASK